MDRYILTKIIVIVVTLGALLQFLPGNVENEMGFGSIQRAIEYNRLVGSKAPGSVVKKAITRFRGKSHPKRIKLFMEFVARIQEEEKLREDPGRVMVQVRGISRNEKWTLAYDLYPIRVIGKYIENGGKSDDPVLPEADWVITQGKEHLMSMERVH